MVKCDVPDCNEKIVMPFICKYCGGSYCSAHRLPEKHNCVYILQKEARLISKQEQVDTQGFHEAPYYSNSIPRRNIPKVRRSTPFIGQSYSWTATSILMIVILVCWVIDLASYGEIMRFNTIAMYSQYYYHMIFTNLFTPNGLWQMIWVMITLYFIIRKVEFAFGPKFVLAFYFGSGFAILLLMFLLQVDGIFTPIFSFLAGLYHGVQIGGYVSAIDGIMMAFMTFYVFYIGVDTEWNFYLYFIPIRLRGRTMLLIFMLFELFFCVMNFVSFDPAAVESLGTLFGFVIGYSIYRLIRRRIPYRDTY